MEEEQKIIAADTSLYNTISIYTNNNSQEPSVKIFFDTGEIEFGSEYNPTDAAKGFWECIARHSEGGLYKQIEELKAINQELINKLAWLSPVSIEQLTTDINDLIGDRKNIDVNQAYEYAMKPLKG